MSDRVLLLVVWWNQELLSTYVYYASYFKFRSPYERSFVN